MLPCVFVRTNEQTYRERYRSAGRQGLGGLGLGSATDGATLSPGHTSEFVGFRV